MPAPTPPTNHQLSDQSTEADKAAPLPSTAAAARVYVVATDIDDASLLIAKMRELLGADGYFDLQAHAASPWGALALASTDAALLLAPPLGASNALTQQAQHTVMQLRQQWVAQGQAFQVLFSQDARLLDDAMSALCNWFPDAPALQTRRAALREHGNLARWSWSCEKCSDPDCELRLFKGLIDSATTTA